MSWVSAFIMAVGNIIAALINRAGKEKIPPPPTSPPPPTTTLPPAPVDAPLTTSASAVLEDAYSGCNFTHDDPYPEGFKSAKLGITASALRSLFPGGEFSSTGFSFSIPKGPFCFVYFTHNAAGTDPKINQISFDLRDKIATEFVRSQAIAAFGTKKMKSKVQGAILRWTVGGLKVQIQDKLYEIRPRRRNT